MTVPSSSSPSSLIDGDMGRALLASSSAAASGRGKRKLSSSATPGDITSSGSNGSSSRNSAMGGGGAMGGSSILSATGSIFINGCGGNEPGGRGFMLMIASVLLYTLCLLATLIMSAQVKRQVFVTC